MFCLTCIGQMFATLSLIYWPACLIIVCMYLINTRVFKKKKKVCGSLWKGSRRFEDIKYDTERYVCSSGEEEGQQHIFGHFCHCALQSIFDFVFVYL